MAIKLFKNAAVQIDIKKLLTTTQWKDYSTPFIQGGPLGTASIVLAEVYIDKFWKFRTLYTKYI